MVIKTKQKDSTMVIKEKKKRIAQWLKKKKKQTNKQKDSTMVRNHFPFFVPLETELIFFFFLILIIKKNLLFRIVLFSSLTCTWETREKRSLVYDLRKLNNCPK